MPPHAATTAFFTLVLLAAGGFARVEHEGNVREDQFCRLVLANVHDQETRLDHTVEFFKSPEAQQSGGLIDYIRRVSFPQSLSDTANAIARVPPICEKYDDEHVLDYAIPKTHGSSP